MTDTVFMTYGLRVVLRRFASKVSCTKQWFQSGKNSGLTNICLDLALWNFSNVDWHVFYLYIYSTKIDYLYPLKLLTWVFTRDSVTWCHGVVRYMYEHKENLHTRVHKPYLHVGYTHTCMHASLRDQSSDVILVTKWGRVRPFKNLIFEADVLTQLYSTKARLPLSLFGKTSDTDHKLVFM